MSSTSACTISRTSSSKATRGFQFSFCRALEQSPCRKSSLRGVSAPPASCDRQLRIPSRAQSSPRPPRGLVRGEPGRAAALGSPGPGETHPPTGRPREKRTRLPPHGGFFTTDLRGRQGAGGDEPGGGGAGRRGAERGAELPLRRRQGRGREVGPAQQRAKAGQEASDRVQEPLSGSRAT
ncbi:PREDICTED: translation initiation factor IF-2-like [Chinchilla lanigera]|uniref:translation initiation factor IF-2-like n=1 Tax=Chinchilla lanigera TaxID=34839 RepID=UPI0006985C18|nr:PREDICTED: translation initiation factor IF-2-like [Chinchilla lanigera]